MPSLGQARTLDDLHLHLWRRSCADEPQTIYGMGSGASRARGGGAEGEDVVCMSYVSGRGPGVEPELPRPSTEHALPSYSTLPDGDIMHGQATFDGLQLMPGGMGRQLEREIIPQAYSTKDAVSFRGRQEDAGVTTPEWDTMRAQMHASSRLEELESMREQLYVKGFSRFYLADAQQAEASGDKPPWNELSTIKPSIQEQLAYEDARLLEDMAYKHQLPRNDLKPPMEPTWAKLDLPEVPVPPLRPRPDELDELEATLPALQLRGLEGVGEEQEAEQAVGALVVVAEGVEQEAASVGALVSVAEGAETMEEEEDAGALVVVAEEAEAVGSPRRRQDFEVGGPLALMRYSESRGVEVELPPPPNIRAWRHDFERERRIKLAHSQGVEYEDQRRRPRLPRSR